jgi:carbonic anhydrase
MMKMTPQIPRIFTKTIGCALVALTSLAVHAEGHPPHWNYEHSHGGPSHWAELDPAFETCAKGTTQSPVDIRNAVKADLPKLDFHYTTAVPTFVNNGHTIQINLPAGQSLTVGDKTYELLQFHFHTPSEEALNGKRTAMVGHFVHKNAAGQLGVIGVLMQPGKTNAAFEPVFAHLPRKGEKITVDELTLDLAAMLPADKGYYSFEGSLTTPPCSEGVNWMVMKNPIQLGAEQIKAFRRIFNANARPIQPLNGRVIKESM